MSADVLVCRYLSTSSPTCFFVVCEQQWNCNNLCMQITSKSFCALRLCVGRSSFTSPEEDWCHQCSQQTNSDFHYSYPTRCASDDVATAILVCSSLLDFASSVMVVPRYIWPMSPCPVLHYVCIFTATSSLIPILITLVFSALIGKPNP